MLATQERAAAVPAGGPTRAAMRAQPAASTPRAQALLLTRSRLAAIWAAARVRRRKHRRIEQICLATIIFCAIGAATFGLLPLANLFDLGAGLLIVAVAGFSAFAAGLAKLHYHDVGSRHEKVFSFCGEGIAVIEALLATEASEHPYVERVLNTFNTQAARYEKELGVEPPSAVTDVKPLLPSKGRHRRHERIKSLRFRDTYIIDAASGKRYAAQLIDLSLSGAAIETDANLDAGHHILIGRRPAKIVRRFSLGGREGLGVEFKTFLKPEEFTPDFRP